MGNSLPRPPPRSGSAGFHAGKGWQSGCLVGTEGMHERQYVFMVLIILIALLTNQFSGHTNLKWRLLSSDIYIPCTLHSFATIFVARLYLYTHISARFHGMAVWVMVGGEIIYVARAATKLSSA